MRPMAWEHDERASSPEGDGRPPRRSAETRRQRNRGTSVLSGPSSRHDEGRRRPTPRSETIARNRVRHAIRRRRRLANSQPYLQAAIAGLAAGGLVSAMMVGLLVGTPTMLERRAELASVAEAADTGDWTGALPPVSWRLVERAPEDALQHDALRQDIASMEPSGEGILGWSVLPFPLIGSEEDVLSTGALPEGMPNSEDQAYAYLMRLVRHVYGDEPALSVYTDGQCVTIHATVSKYRLDGELPSTAEDNKREYEDVTKRVDELSNEVRSVAGDDPWAYARTAYSTVCSLSTYSDGDRDTRHYNDIYGALIEGETQCYGISGALKALLDKGGIPSFIASGSLGDSPDNRHAWVMAWIDDAAGGEWLAMDGTCSQGQNPPDESGISSPYWAGCLVPVDEYMRRFGTTMDKE